MPARDPARPSRCRRPDDWLTGASEPGPTRTWESTFLVGTRRGTSTTLHGLDVRGPARRPLG
jgi:hypothetical protein